MKILRLILANLAGGNPTPSLRRLIWVSALIFVVAAGLRLLHWQDNFATLEAGGTFLADIDRPYKAERQRLIADGSLLFPNRPMENGDARMILHPPGYSILLLMFGDANTALRLFHIGCDSLAAVLIFLIVAEILPLTAAFISGMFIAFSPHLAYYALWFTPDSLAVLPILVSIYLLIKASKRPRWLTIILAGAILGLSSWLRSNGLLLAPFMALIFILLFERGKRWRYAAGFVGATILVIAPITIRNWMIYDQFVPTSIGAGLNLLEGIADYDRENRFDMPQYDNDVKDRDVIWHNRRDYAGNLWSPDGIERDRYRFSRGLQVIRQNPIWFFGAMLKRTGFMLRYNDQGESRWPLGTSQVATLSAAPPFGSQIAENRSPDRAISPAEFLSNGRLISSHAQAVLIDDGSMVQISGDASAYADQFVSAPIAVEPHIDYVVAIPLTTLRNGMAVKVTSDDQRITLATGMLTEDRRTLRKKAKNAESSPTVKETESIDPLLPSVRLIRFASGESNAIRLVISNDSPTIEPPIIQIGQTEFTALAATPNQWTKWLRPPIRGVQKNLFTTSRMLTLIAIGIALLAFAKGWRALALLLVVPFYYLSIQSLLHTEYRYILGLHYLLMSFAGVTFYGVGAFIHQLARRKFKWS